MEINLVEKNIDNIQLNDNPESLDKRFNNFKKVNLSYNNINIELAISIYSNLIFIIITGNSKLGYFYIGELEEDEENMLDPIENIYEIKCLMGDRQNESHSFLSNYIITNVFNKIRASKSGNFMKIQKILLSSSIKFAELFDTISLENENDLVFRPELKEFLNTLLKKIDELLNY